MSDEVGFVSVVIIDPSGKKWSARVNPNANGEDTLDDILIEIKSGPGLYTMSIIGAERIRQGATIAISKVDSVTRCQYQVVVEVPR